MYVYMYICIYVYMYICVFPARGPQTMCSCIHCSAIILQYFLHSLHTYIHGPSADRRSIGYVPEACAKKHVRDVSKTCPNHVQKNAHRTPRICPNQHKARCIYSSLDVYKSMDCPYNLAHLAGLLKEWFT